MKDLSRFDVLSIPSDNTGAALFPPHSLAGGRGLPYLSLARPRSLDLMDSLINTAASTHHIHLVRAQKALECTPPRFDLFYFHSAMCNATVKALDILQAHGEWTALGCSAPTIPLDDILSSLQPTEDAASSSKPKQES